MIFKKSIAPMMSVNGKVSATFNHCFSSRSMDGGYSSIQRYSTQRPLKILNFTHRYFDQNDKFDIKKPMFLTFLIKNDKFVKHLIKYNFS